MAKKRANGEGNIRKRKDGRWEGRYTADHDPETGKAIYKNVLAKTQKECKEKLAAALEQAGKVDAHKTDQFTVAFQTSSLQCLRPLLAWSGSAFGSDHFEKGVIHNGTGLVHLTRIKVDAHSWKYPFLDCLCSPFNRGGPLQDLGRKYINKTNNNKGKTFSRK